MFKFNVPKKKIIELQEKKLWFLRERKFLIMLTTFISSVVSFKLEKLWMMNDEKCQIEIYSWNIF